MHSISIDKKERELIEFHVIHFNSVTAFVAQFGGISNERSRYNLNGGVEFVFTGGVNNMFFIIFLNPNNKQVKNIKFKYD